MSRASAHRETRQVNKMNNETTLIPVAQKQVVFYGDEITAVLVREEGQAQIYVPLRPLCDYLGLNWSGQRQRLLRDLVLSKKMKTVVVETDQRGSRDTLCLPLEFINGWLFGIDSRRVRDTVRDRLLRYQEECYRVLSTAFLETEESEIQPSRETQSLMQIREMGRAIMQMAEQQLALTARVDKAAVIVGEHGRRITNLEQQLAPRQAITDEQATDIAEKVKALAMALTEKDSSKNQFQSIFAELYRRFRVSSYKVIRQSQYHLVMDFLDEWAETVAKAKKAT